MHKKADVLIVGGGVVGLACGLALQEAGRQVRVVDAGAAGQGSSHGNCGTLTPSHALPLAVPGTIGRALRWMLTPDAPLYLAPRADPLLWRWMLRFAGNCNERAALVAARARVALLQASRDAFPAWLASHAIEAEFEQLGVDHVFRDPGALGAFLPECEALADLGIAHERIAGDAYLRGEPALREGVAGVVRFPGDASLRPDRYVAGLARALAAAGGEIFEHCAVHGVQAAGDGMQALTDRGVQHARDVIVATGAWTPRLALSPALASLRAAMQPGKGYSITYDRPALAPRRPLVLHERSVCVTTWGSGYRLGSTMEFSGYDTTLNRRRLDALERGAREYLREPVGAVVREEWYGWRPMSCDDVPILGAVPGERHLWVATGHGMLGVSMIPATALLLCDL
ncbi:MAG TPA: FAD-dependent oxidoreductase, partial [Xanthomonadaceae bacterium]|nr:FAD-dependent oxidoreductase [Xanthomonadaceae bacterium]